jgi:predicted nucleotidyltransferase
MIDQKKIISLFKPLKKQKGLQVFLHGSYADNSTTPFSDIDDFIIIDDTQLTKEELIFVNNELKKIENSFYQIDPLQHHGHWLVKKSELEDYNNSYIPLFILDNSIVILGDSNIKANINFDKTIKGLHNNIKVTCKNIELFYKKYKDNLLNIHYLKCFVGSIVLLPPLLFQLKGFNYDKKTSIEKAGELFLDFSLDLIKWATDLRNNWFQIVNSKEFKNFVNEQKNVGLENWKSYSEQNSPILKIDTLSKINLSDSLIDSFINDCVHILESCSLKKYDVSKYDSLYSEIESYAVHIGATVVGKFGEIKHSGISDLDVFICFPDNIYKESLKKLNKFINSKRENIYFVIHPTVCIPESLIPHLKYLHTVSNLTITFNLNKTIVNTTLDKNYNDMINVFWTFFLIPIAEEYILDIKYRTSRELLLLLKNIHTSIDNLHKIKGIESKFKSKSNDLRNKVLRDNTFDKEIIKEEFKKDFEILINLINSMDENKNRRLIVTRNFVISSGNYQILKTKSKLYFNLPFYFFNLMKSAFYNIDNNQSIKKYITSYSFSLDYFRANNLENQFIQLVPFLHVKNKSFLKKTIFYILSYIPDKFLKRFF